MYIIIYWRDGDIKRFALTKENENTLRLFKTRQDAKKMAETLKKGEHEYQKREGQYSRIKESKYAISKVKVF